MDDEGASWRGLGEPVSSVNVADLKAAWEIAERTEFWPCDSEASVGFVHFSWAGFQRGGGGQTASSSYLPTGLRRNQIRADGSNAHPLLPAIAIEVCPSILQ